MQDSNIDPQYDANGNRIDPTEEVPVDPIDDPVTQTYRDSKGNLRDARTNELIDSRRHQVARRVIDKPERRTDPTIAYVLAAVLLVTACILGYLAYDNHTEKEHWKSIAQQQENGKEANERQADSKAEEASQLEERVDELASENSSLESEVSRLETENERLQSENEDLRQDAGADSGDTVNDTRVRELQAEIRQREQCINGQEALIEALDNDQEVSNRAELLAACS